MSMHKVYKHKMAGRRREPEKMPMAALQLLAVHAYCLRRCALPSTFFRLAWPGVPVRATGVLIRFAGLLGSLWTLTERHQGRLCIWPDSGINADPGESGMPVRAVSNSGPGTWAARKFACWHLEIAAVITN